MKSNKKRAGGKTGAIVALCVVLVITVVLGVLGVNMIFPGMYLN